MAAVFDFDNALGVKEWLRGLHRRGEPRLRKDKVKCGEYFLVCEQSSGAGREKRAERRENFCDFLLLGNDQLAVFVVQAHGDKRLDENGRAGGTLVVHHARKFRLVLAFHGETVAAVTHGHDGIHEIALVAVDFLLQSAVHALVGRLHLPPDASKLGARRVGDQLLREDAALQFPLFFRERGERRERGFECVGIRLRFFVRAVIPGSLA